MSTTTNAISVDEAIQAILDSATEEDIERIYQAANTRSKQLGAKRALAVKTGQDVTLEGLRPKYFNGLRGTVKSIQGNRATVTLDEESTELLRYKGSRRVFIPSDTTRYDLSGIPKSCLVTE